MAQTVILGEKVGMTQKWVDDKVIPVTVLRVEPMRIVQIKTTERDGYTALQVTQGRVTRRSSPSRSPATTQRQACSLVCGWSNCRVDTVDGYVVGQEITVEALPAAAASTSPASAAARASRAP
jgi:large subunit ribosomal protein L3